MKRLLNINKEILQLISLILIASSLVIFLLYLFPIILLLSDFDPVKIKDSFSITGTIGDTINGIFNPIIGILAVITTFLAFIIQYRANNLYRKDIEFQRFETRFYELLKIHKDNINEINIENKHQGRNSFIQIFNEFRFLYLIIEDAREGYINLYPEDNLDLSYEKLIELAYFILFFGTATKIRPEDLGKISIYLPFYIYCMNKIKIHKDYFYKIYDKNTKDPISIILSRKNEVDESRIVLMTDFCPFNGHSAILGHYFRHLYQTVKFIANSKELKYFPAKYEYMKIIRAQLSNFEQVMLFYNSYFFSGEIWWEDPSVNFKSKSGSSISYFLDFLLIKNLPFNLIDFGIHPRDAFHQKLTERGLNEDEIQINIKHMFEWLEN